VSRYGCRLHSRREDARLGPRAQSTHGSVICAAAGYGLFLAWKSTGGPVRAEPFLTPLGSPPIGLRIDGPYFAKLEVNKCAWAASANFILKRSLFIIVPALANDSGLQSLLSNHKRSSANHSASVASPGFSIYTTVMACRFLG
jgi:hypothetical protein